MQSQTIREQSQMVWDLRNRAKMRDGNDAAETWVCLRPDDLDRLERLAMRLERMSIHEDAIKRLVVGK